MALLTTKGRSTALAAEHRGQMRDSFSKARHCAPCRSGKLVGADQMAAVPVGKGQYGKLFRPFQSQGLSNDGPKRGARVNGGCFVPLEGFQEGVRDMLRATK
jgi:hypothetical protein